MSTTIQMKVTDSSGNTYWTCHHYQAEFLRRAVEAGLENSRELLAHHDTALGRTTVKNTYTADLLERDIARLEEALRFLPHVAE